MSELNEATVSSITTFVQEARAEEERIPSAILITGPSLASHDHLFDQLGQATKHSGRISFVSLTSQQCPNLKTLLKHLISRAASNEIPDEGDEDDQLVSTKRKGPRLLNYDLQILQNAVEDQKLDKVVVAFQDCEAYDGSLLSDAIELMRYVNYYEFRQSAHRPSSSWQDRIPFILLFGVATSIEGLQAKLSRRAIRCIRGRRFDVVQAETALERLFQSLHIRESKIWLGAGICSTLLSRQRDHLQSLQAFVDAVQYAYMTNFYANALSIFLDVEVVSSEIPKDHFEALRNLPSFAVYTRSLLDSKQARIVRQLLDDDNVLLEHVHQKMRKGQTSLAEMLDAVETYSALQSAFSNLPQTSLSDLYVHGFSGGLLNSVSMRSLFLSLRKANSETLLAILQDLNAVTSGSLRGAVETLLNDLSELVAEQQNGDAPLRSEEDVHKSTLRTTVIAKKVELSKQKSTLTKADSAFSEILGRFVKTMDDHFTETLINPKDLPFNEVFLYDLKSPHRDVFTPKPRHAVERALASPHDYLDCDCCGAGDEEATLSGSQPSTAILYQLYLESGTLINAADLRSAFAAIVADEVEDEAKISALFQRSLAELRYLGLVKGTKKRTDHIIKASWRGL